MNWSQIAIGNNAFIEDGGLFYYLVSRENLGPEIIDLMFVLMAKNYDHMSRVSFEKDLAVKQYVGMIASEDDELVGFTTYAVNPKGSGTENYNIIFSGDTIIDPAHWGTQIIVKGWTMSVGWISKSDQLKKWYWYLMSKGHRTYLYLPLFFESYYPAPEPGPEQYLFKSIAHEVSNLLYGEYWKPEKGIIEFSDNQGSLKKELSDDSFKKSKSPNIAFFLEKNPGFEKGDELVCITEISADNFRRSVKNYFLRGYEATSND